jgi:hypothetical protein
MGDKGVQISKSFGDIVDLAGRNGGEQGSPVCHNTYEDEPFVPTEIMSVDVLCCATTFRPL